LGITLAVKALAPLLAFVVAPCRPWTGCCPGHPLSMAATRCQVQRSRFERQRSERSGGTERPTRPVEDNGERRVRAELAEPGYVVTVSQPIGGVLSRGRSPVCDHPSKRSTWRRSLRCGRARHYLTFDLAPSGVYLATPVTRNAGALLPHRFTLTCAQLPARS